MHKVHWAVPAPRWADAAAQGTALGRAAAMRRPMILRFASDAFMEELAAILDDDPERLAEVEARAGETWREYPGSPALPAADATLLSTPVRRRLGARFKLTGAGKASGSGKAAPKAGGDAPTEPPALKLFQPSHQRYYLVAASLVCRFPGLPDHRVDPGKQERASFVVRRLVPKDPNAKSFDPDPAKSDEYAFVSSDEGPAWVLVPQQPDAPPATVPGEEQLPMFGSPYTGTDGVPRRLFTGLVPVSRREAYVGAPRRLPAAPSVSEDNAAKMGAFPEPVDTRAVMLIDDVIGPWRELQAQARKFNTDTVPEASKAGDPREALKLALQMRDRILQVSWLVLLDFAAYLRRYLPQVTTAIEASSPNGLTTAAERALYTALTQVSYEANDRTKVTLAEALKGFDTPQRREQLENGPTLLTDDTRSQFAGVPRFALAEIAWPPVTDPTKPPNLNDRAFAEQFTFSGPVKVAAPTAIKNAVEAVLKEHPPDAAVPPPPPAAQAVLPVDRTTRFVLRCVFDRPRCGAFAPSVVSERTDPFAMAPFFDPDAPARPVRIALPVDTSPAGLRKYQKSASFLISDVLCGQMGAARSLTLGDLVLSVLPWPFHKPLPEPKVQMCSDIGLGMVCSLSIPIVTICALILLIIIVSILDIFFRWLPFLITCFPLPLRAKEQV